MKVRCITLLNSRGQPVERSAWAKVGAVYHVLGIWIEPSQTRLRLVGEQPTPALFEPEMFEVVSSIVPSMWVVTFPRSGCLSFAPAEWSGPGFWEAFFDREPNAVACFEEQRRMIIASDP
jgi:hypothetical protein